jgi:hypothetical protein
MGNRNTDPDLVSSGGLGAGARLRFGPRAHKYRAQRTEAADGTSFPSKAEARRYAELREQERLGLIGDLKLHPRWRFTINGVQLAYEGRAIVYTADSTYRDLTTGETIVEDVKGMLTADARLRIALMLAVHGIKVRLHGVRRKKKRRG